MMAALSRRDIEMIFRADTDKATRPIADLGKAVKTARGQLEDLVSAASTSEDALDKLGDTTRELKKAQDELGSARSLLTSFNAQNAAIEKAEAKVAAASAKFLELKERVEGAEKPTKVLVTSMNNAERALNAAQESLDRVSAEAKETKEQIESIIGPVASVDAGFREIANTSKEIARGLALAGDEADNFRKRIAAAASANSDVDKKLNADVAFEQQGRSAGLLQAQIDYISQFENRVELLNQAKRELTSQNAAFDQALQAQDAKVGAANVSELRRSIQETFAEDERAKQISAFKQIATDANAAVTDVSRFAVAEDAAAASGQRFSDSIRDILSPANAAKASIDGVEAAVAEAAGVLEGKGRKTLTEYNMAMNELLASGASIGGIAKQIDAFRDQQAALAATGAKYRELVADAESAALAIRLSDAPTQEMVNDLKRLEAQVTTAGNAMKTEGEKAEVMSIRTTWRARRSAWPMSRKTPQIRRRRSGIRAAAKRAACSGLVSRTLRICPISSTISSRSLRAGSRSSSPWRNRVRRSGRSKASKASSPRSVR
jgi:myosin heavy subunit